MADAGLEVDYSFVELPVCICGRPKEIGEMLCGTCHAALPLPTRVRLDAMKPGDGIAGEVRLAYERMLRAGKGWSP